MDWYRLNKEEIFALLETGDGGLSTHDSKAKLVTYGLNELREEKKQTIADLLFSQFKDLMILILLSAAIISGIIGELTDSIVIIVIVLLNAVVGFLQEYRAEKAMQALKQLGVTTARILRDGISTWIPATELVPGDVIILEAGNAVPADVRIIESISLKVDEAALTGESNAVDKVVKTLASDDLPVGDRINMAFKGTFVTYGRGTAIVIATGMRTEIGQIAKLLQEEETSTPLQERMASFGKKLSVLVLLLCVLFFVAGWLRGENLIKMLMTSISLAVAAIPEALPAVITISLALAAKRMIRLNSLIRKLPAVETLGSVTYICTDKTGTLTKNKMHVEELYFQGERYERNGLFSFAQTTAGKLMLQACMSNNDAVRDSMGNFKGDSTEIALFELAIEQKVETADWPRIAEIAFDSERKLMTTFHLHNDQIISFTKGAPDILLQRCVEIDVQSTQEQVNLMAGNGLRVLGFAWKHWDKMPEHPDCEFHETGLQFLGLAGIIDPPRDEVAGAVSQCKIAGIMPVMITGDHPLTAKTIASRIGILAGDQDLVITGQELAAMDIDSFLGQVERIKVYARVSPEQKLNIVKI
ncbi:MAG: HAD family hydrolase [Sphingobacteriales bacterium]|nr:MAG: HAD family hydrolase [Sphingobacteriales bacterium]